MMAAKRELGRTGIKVFPVGLGGMPLSIENRPDEARALEVLKASLDAGVTFIDTANVYCLDDSDIGHNERLIRKALETYGKTEEVQVATKGGLRRPNGDWTRDASPACLRESCEASLRALQTDAIFLYQLHAPDSKVPLEDSVGELKRLQEEGKIRHVGLSNVSLDELGRAQKIVRVESVQNRCNPFEHKDYTNGLLRACEEQGVSYLPYSTVGGHQGHARVKTSRKLDSVAAKYNASRYAVIVAWHLGKSGCVIPIPGASRVESAKDSPKAAELVLSGEDCATLDALAAEG